MEERKKISKKLKGKELADYIKKYKDQFKGDGDQLCLAAGYGQPSKDGNNMKCDLPLFIKEFSEAMEIED